MAEDPKLPTTPGATPPAPYKPQPTPEEEAELRMTFTEHLGELRTRIIRSFWALLVCFALCYAFSNRLINLLQWPLRGAVIHFETVAKDPPPAEDAAAPEGAIVPVNDTDLPPAEDGVAPEATHVPVNDVPVTDAAALDTAIQNLQTVSPELKTVLAQLSARLAVLEGDVPVENPLGTEVPWIALNPIEPVVVQIKISLYAGLLFAMPFILWQMCAFIFPGLHRGERQLVRILLVGCSVLGIVGMCIAYFGVFPLVLPYLLMWLPEGVIMQLRMNETITIILYGLLGFAIAFQFPMVVLILVYLDLLTPAALREYRKIAVLIIAVISAVLTPADPISMMIMMLPLVLLYEASIWTSYLVVRRRDRKAAQQA